MKNNMLILIICFIGLSFGCKTEGDCNAYVNVKNQSNDNVVAAIKIVGAGGCRLSGFRLAHNEIWEYKPFRTCIERHMGNQEILEIYIVDVNKYNDPDIMYNCDSIPIRNNILKHYKLTKDSLIQLKFNVVYR